MRTDHQDLQDFRIIAVNQLQEREVLHLIQQQVTDQVLHTLLQVVGEPQDLIIAASPQAVVQGLPQVILQDHQAVVAGLPVQDQVHQARLHHRAGVAGNK